ncbi:lipoprotein [Streptomyces sp. NL15-2K]|nr:lipoprotein [Streptomyces sp. NL15-2K]
MRGAALAGSLALLPLATACGGGDDEAARSGPTKTSVTAAAAAGVVAPAKVEVIAGLTGCKVKIRVEAEELREGVCHTKKGDYLITTFPQEKYQKTWLESAAVYGGKYLVGSRWVVSGQPKMLEQFRPTLGGTIQQMRGIGPTAAPSGS